MRIGSLWRVAAAVTAAAAIGGVPAGLSQAADEDRTAPRVRISGPACASATLVVRVRVRDSSALRGVRVSWRKRTVRVARLARGARSARVRVSISRRKLGGGGKLRVSAVDGRGNRARASQGFIPCRSVGFTG